MRALVGSLFGAMALVLGLLAAHPGAAVTGTVPAAAMTASETVRFAVIGDYGSDGPDEAAVAGLVHSWSPDFVVTVGDNNYDSGSAATIDRNIGKYYHDFISPYAGGYGDGATSNRFWPSLGNHDWETAGAQPYLGYFTLPGNERYYTTQIGPVGLFALDSDPREPDGTSPNGVQGQWLRGALGSSAACWKLVYFHHPPYSSGEHGSSTWMRWPFQAWGASAVLAGHDHTYERIDVNGLPYFISGLGGKSVYGFGAPVAGSQARYNARFGALRVTASRTAITYEFVAVDGTVVDTYSQSGGCTEPPTPTATSTPIPTDTPAPTPTPTPFVSCSPRPQVRVRAAPLGAGRLAVTVSVAAPDTILSISFGAATNAVIEAGSLTGETVMFSVRRAAPGSFTVPFTVIDRCGPWPTFVGGGTAVS